MEKESSWQGGKEGDGWWQGTRLDCAECGVSTESPAQPGR